MNAKEKSATRVSKKMHFMLVDATVERKVNTSIKVGKNPRA
jgi:hypothetical protein